MRRRAGGAVASRSVSDAADLVLEPALHGARAVARIERVGDGAAAHGGARVDERVALAQAAAREQLGELLVDDLRRDLVA